MARGETGLFHHASGHTIALVHKQYDGGGSEVADSAATGVVTVDLILVGNNAAGGGYRPGITVGTGEGEFSFAENSTVTG